MIVPVSGLWGPCWTVPCVREAELVSEMEIEALQKVDKMVVGTDGTGLAVLGVDDGMGCWY